MNDSWNAGESELSVFKMEGIGNDYVYHDYTGGSDPRLSGDEIRALSDRRFGVGGDGVVLVAESDRADARMIMYNADGSRSGMCGNALRCVAFYVGRKLDRPQLRIESDTGVHECRILEDQGQTGTVEVRVGPPRLEPASIPAEPGAFPGAAGAPDKPLVNVSLPLDAGPVAGALRATMVSMGNPHCVIFVDDARTAPLEELGPVLERHPAFPERTNVEFVSRQADGSLLQRTYERGSGETLACGSGACAALVASTLALNAPRHNRIELLGGSLDIEWEGAGMDGDLIMRGPVRHVFTARIARASLSNRDQAQAGQGAVRL